MHVPSMLDELAPFTAWWPLPNISPFQATNWFVRTVCSICRLEEELVRVAREAHAAKQRAAVAEAVTSDLEELRCHHAAAVELLGEREEELMELRADVDDMRSLYRDQVDVLATELAAVSGGRS
jgi:hypothetical protein